MFSPKARRIVASTIAVFVIISLLLGIVLIGIR